MRSSSSSSYSNNHNNRATSSSSSSCCSNGRLWSSLITRCSKSSTFRILVVLVLLSLYSTFDYTTPLSSMFSSSSHYNNNKGKKKKQGLNILSTDFHIGPIGDLKDLMRRHSKAIAHTTITDLSLSQACVHTKTCATHETLHVLKSGVPEHSLYFDRDTRMQFFDKYRKERMRPGTLLERVDAVICSHPIGMCELYMPFNMSIILWATTRFEQGREEDGDRMTGLVKNIQAIASKPWNIVAANNLYDVHYINYFTGVMPVYIPSLCAYTGAKYQWAGPLHADDLNPVTLSPEERAKQQSRSFWWLSLKPFEYSAEEKFQRRIIPVFGYRPGIQFYSLKKFLHEVNILAQDKNLPFQFQNIHEAYFQRRYKYSELYSHPAILHLPYQVSIMSFYEQYKAGIPIIAPSLDLLTRWHMEITFISERGWRMRKLNSVIPRHSEAVDPEDCDPNNDLSYEAVSHWLQYADYYVYPHVILFDSWPDLVEKLANIDLFEVSARMREHARYLESDILNKWRNILAFHTSLALNNKLKPLVRFIGGGQDEDEMNVEEEYARRMDLIYGEGTWEAY